MAQFIENIDKFVINLAQGQLTKCGRIGQNLSLTFELLQSRHLCYKYKYEL